MLKIVAMWIAYISPTLGRLSQSDCGHTGLFYNSQAEFPCRLIKYPHKSNLNEKDTLHIHTEHRKWTGKGQYLKPQGSPLSDLFSLARFYFPTTTPKPFQINHQLGAKC